MCLARKDAVLGMFGKKKAKDKFEIIAEKLRAAKNVEETLDWKRSCEIAVGGLIAVGFYESADKPHLDKLIAIGSQGQTIIDCLSGEIVYRNREQDGYDPATLSAYDLSGQGTVPIRMSGIDGGGLKRCTQDGWSVEAIPIEWPIFYYILQYPETSIYSDHVLGRVSEFELIDYDYQQTAWGFSNSGNTLLLTSSSDIILWSRTKPLK